MKKFLGAGATVFGITMLGAMSLPACGSKDRPSFPEGPTDDAGGFGTSLGDASGNLPQEEDPSTCEQAASSKSYVGCDYWPTITANLVAPVFDYAIAVANTGKEKANVTVTGPSGTNEKASVDPGSITTIF